MCVDVADETNHLDFLLHMESRMFRSTHAGFMPHSRASRFFPAQIYCTKLVIGRQHSHYAALLIWLHIWCGRSIWRRNPPMASAPRIARLMVFITLVPCYFVLTTVVLRWVSLGLHIHQPNASLKHIHRYRDIPSRSGGSEPSL